MSALASQITSLTIIYSTTYPGADERKYHSSASLAFVRRIYRWPVNYKGPVTRKMFPSDDVIIWTQQHNMSRNVSYCITQWTVWSESCVTVRVNTATSISPGGAKYITGNIEVFILHFLSFLTPVQIVERIPSQWKASTALTESRSCGSDFK